MQLDSIDEYIFFPTTGGLTLKTVLLTFTSTWCIWATLEDWSSKRIFWKNIYPCLNDSVPVTLDDPVGITGLLPSHGDRGVGDGVGGHVEGGGGHALVRHHDHCGGGPQSLRVPHLLTKLLLSSPNLCPIKPSPKQTFDLTHGREFYDGWKLCTDLEAD